MPRSTPRSKRSESRRSSILKPRKPRQPLQNVNFDSPHNEKSSSPSKVKRRVSFADKKHVKEFCHSSEQGTVWDSTYEERDSSLKGSFDSNAKTESMENASLCVTTHEYVHIFESNSSCQVNSFVLTNDQLSESVITVKGKDEENCNLDFTNPVKQMELSNEGSQFEQTILPNRSAVFQPSKDAILSNIACSNTDEKYVESFDERPPVEQVVVPNALPIAHALKNAVPSIVIYRDSDEEENVNNPGIKSYTECNNIELNKTHKQDLSMEFTAPVPTPSLVSCAQEKINAQKDNYTLRLNLDTNYVSNNVSTLAVPEACKKPVNSDLGIFDQISEMQNRGSTNWSAGPNNIHDKMIFSTNLQSNVASESTIFKQTQDATQNVNESMMLTNVIQPFTANTDVSRTNNTAFNASMEMTTAVSSKMYERKSISQNIIKESDLRENQTDKTEFFNDVMMEMTKPVNVLPSTPHNKENLRMDELISKEDRTVFFHNVSMEITKPLKNREENTCPIPICKSVFEESTRKEKNMDISTGSNEKTKLLCKSMEFTEAVPVSLHHESTPDILCTAQSIVFPQTMSTACSPVFKNSTDSILQIGTVSNKMIQDTSMEITTAIPSTLHLTRDATSEKENLNVSKDNEFHYLTTSNLIESRKSAESTLQAGTAAIKTIQDTSMEITTAVPSTLHLTRDATSKKEKNLNIFKDNEFQYLTKNDLREESRKIAESILVDTAASKMIQDASMEVTTAVPSTLHLTRDATSEKKNLNISKDNEFHHLTTNNLIESRKNATKENYTILRKIATDTHNELPNNSIISSNLHHSLDAVLKSVNSRRKTFDENEQPSPKICKLLMNSHTSQENNVCLSSSANGIYANDTGHNEYFVKDTTMDHTELSRSNFEDNPNESGECSLLRKTLGDSIEELQSIKPPSFILDSDKEENSFSDVSCEDKLQTSTNNGTINNIHNSSNQLVTNNVGEYECLAESRDSVAKDNENFTILRENEHDREDQVNCQVIKRTTIDNQINESNHCTVNIENSHAKNVLLTQNNKHEEENTDHCKSKPIVKESEITADREYIRERINGDANSRNDIKEQQCIDRPKKTEIIENQSSSEKSCKENLNDEVTGMKRNEKCTEERFAAERCVSTIIDESLAEQDPFLSLSQKLEIHGERDDCIWNVYHNNIDRKMIVFGFMSNSLLIAIFLSYDINCSERNLIDKIKVISRISDDSGVLIRIVHKLILEKLDAESLMHRYRIHEDILPMLECVSQHVKLAMNFIFDLKQLDDLNLMEITYDEISFLSRSKQMDIILKVTIKVKRFDELTSKDVNVNCLLGTIRENDVKSLIKNIKKDHKFLRKFMNDVKDYIDIMEETLIFKKV